MAISTLTQPLSSELVLRAGPFNATEIMCDESGYSKEEKKKKKKERKKEDRDTTLIAEDE